MVQPILTRLLSVYRIGPGPSSSHTVGPMRAARAFRMSLLDAAIAPSRLRVDLKGSLSATGRGHGTGRAVLGGLQGWEPEHADVDALRDVEAHLTAHPEIAWGEGTLRLVPDDVRYLPYRAYRDELLAHPNTMHCLALDDAGEVLAEQVWLSVGGGFIQQVDGPGGDTLDEELAPPVLPFEDGESLVAAAELEGIGLGDVVLRNEQAWFGAHAPIEAGLATVWDAMRACIRRGLATEGALPGGLGMRRRAGDLKARVDRGDVEPGYAHIARAQSYAFAINEENADGGRVVTAPTNGAAGVFPAVLAEAQDRLGLSKAQVHRALATGAAIALLVKTHASLSGAEVGCQGEVGSATAMAAAALCELLGGNPRQVAYAAEIAIEHNLGLTCDPLKGLVQAPCIERNAMGVAKAWSAAQLARHSRGDHLISLDRVIHVMKRTGDDMKREYKETGEGGLAVSFPEC